MNATLESQTKHQADYFMDSPVLSVLIPSIPSRLTRAGVLFRYLESLAAALPAEPYLGFPEILMLTDNKQRSIGMKRRALVEMAKGDYVAFVDDDDMVSSDYFSRIFETLATANRGTRTPVDVVTFDTSCQLNGGPVVMVYHRWKNPNDQYNPQGFRRAPWHMHAWRRELAQAHVSSFPDLSNAEDWPWCESMLRDTHTAVHITGGPLFHYRHDARTSEASK